MDRKKGLVFDTYATPTPSMETHTSKHARCDAPAIFWRLGEGAGGRHEWTETAKAEASSRLATKHVTTGT